MPESVIAAIATLIGAIGLKTFEWIKSRSDEKKAAKAAVEEKAERSRQQTIVELKQELGSLEGKMEELVGEIEEWKDKYWTLREEHVKRLADLEAALNKLKELKDEQG